MVLQWCYTVLDPRGEVTTARGRVSSVMCNSTPLMGGDSPAMVLESDGYGARK
jgi:hypothetical protein